MKKQSLAIALGAIWISGAAADLVPRDPDLVASISFHPGSVPALSDPDYSTWVVEDGVSSSEFSLDGLTFTLTAQDIDADGPVGTLVGGSNDAVYTTPNSPFGERMVGAGVTTAETQGSLKLKISGLPEGHYWTYSWFNSWEETNRGGAVFLNVNGRGRTYLRPQTFLAPNIFESSVLAIDINGGEDVEIVWQSYRIQPGNLFLTGFEINGVNPWSEISYPSPANREEVAASGDGEVLASWALGREDPSWPRTFDVFFGPSPDALESVAVDQTETEFLFTGLESGQTYYWQVDMKFEHTSDQYLPGRTLSFTVA